MCNQENDFVDVQENRIIELDPQILQTLLRDMSSGKNIIWAVDDYQELGDGYQSDDEITLERITGDNGGMIKPRAVKSKENKSNRTRNMAEVFTPLWICNKQNNLFDNVWFGRENVFNTEIEKNWTVCEEKIHFPNDNHHGKDGWEDYISLTCLEITCGEAPYLVSRYDTLSGEPIPLKQRIGLLDRKLRVINERTRNFKNKERSRKRWLELAKKALQSTYGFEWQGDNVLLARENLLYTVVDYYKAKFAEDVPLEWLWHFAEIISWNIWQMDGLKCVVPNSCHDYKKNRKIFAPNMFDTKYFTAKALKRSLGYSDVDEDELQKCQGCLKDNIFLHNGIYAKIKNWSTGKIIQFKDLLDEQGSEVLMGKDFKFDVVIGNPPYQENSKNTSDKPVYDKLMSTSYEVADKALFITPARFLFNAGKTPKVWNKKMLDDEHLKVVYYTSDSSKIFPTTEIKGGVVITYRSSNEVIGPIGVFTKYEKLHQIVNLVRTHIKDDSLTNFMYLQNRFDLDALYCDHPEYKNIISSEGRERRIVSSSFSKLDVFKDTKESSNDISILGVTNSNNRGFKWIDKRYVEDNGNLKCWKVVVAKTNGNGNLGEVLASPQVLHPNEGYTQSFIGIGSFDKEIDAIAALKYVKTKFVRILLGTLKITQDNPPEKWKYIPLQDFTSSSDIDWSKSIAEIDRQLYKKYNLSDEEINFIETNVKEMK